MRLIKTTIEDLFILEPSVFAGNRGYFFESYDIVDDPKLKDGKE